jgi:hypothetical protein
MHAARERQRRAHEPRAGLATLLLVAGAFAGFVWWRKRSGSGSGSGSGARGAAGSAFRFPGAKKRPERPPAERRANNKKDKRRRAEERERRAEKRERACVCSAQLCTASVPSRCDPCIRSYPWLRRRIYYRGIEQSLVACREEQPTEKRDAKDPDDPNNTCAPAAGTAELLSLAVCCRIRGVCWRAVCYSTTASTTRRGETQSSSARGGARAVP